MKKFAFVLLCAALWLTGCGIDEGPMPEDEFLVIAHRGASAYVPENTLASYELAEDLDADYIELDIHLTKDGELVVMHDQDVKSTMDASGKISEFTLDELKKLSKTSRYKDNEDIAAKGNAEMYAVPALREVFEQLGDRMNFIIELKNPEDYPGIEEKLMDLLEAADMIGSDENGHPKAVIQSFNEKGLEKIHALNEEIPLLKLISFEENEESQLTSEEIEKLQTYAAGIGVSYEALTESFISYMQQQGLVVYAYTVNDKETALKMKNHGANGIHTDRPDILEK